MLVAVDPRPQVLPVGVGIGLDPGAHRREGVGGLGAPPVRVVFIAVFLLPVARADVVAAGVTQDVVQGVFLGYVAAGVLNHDHHFAFGVEPLHLFGPNDGVLGSDDAGGGLMENHGVLGSRAVTDVAGVVQAHCQDLPWVYGGQQLDVGYIVDMVCEFDR